MPRLGADEAVLRGLVRVAALLCDAPMAGLGIRHGDSLQLAAGMAIGPEALALLPPMRPDNVIAMDPAEGVGFGAAIMIECDGSGPGGVLFVMDHVGRPAGLTARQEEGLRLLAAQAVAVLSLAATRAAERLYREAFQSAAVDLVLIDVGRDGTYRIEDANRTHLRNGGFSRASLIGRTAPEAFAPDTAALARSRYASVVETGQPVEYEARVPFPSGERVRHSVMAPVREADGRIGKILLTSVDMTEARQTEAALRQAQKMQAIGQLTGGVAHDFNNVLTAIRGSLDLLLEQTTEPSARQRIDTALRAAERGAQLTRQLLTFARRQTITAKPVGVKALIEGMADLLRLAMGSAVQVKCALADDLWPVLADHTAVEQAILNLALNARDAMPQGGRLLIEAANTIVPPRDIEPPAGEYVRVAVIDEGHGMSPDVLERALEPFFTTKSGGQGTGLGLAQVYGLITQFGGSVRLRSAEGKGTTAEIYLCRLAPDAEARQATRLIRPPVRG